jgi:hypothetical protein
MARDPDEIRFNLVRIHALLQFPARAKCHLRPTLVFGLEFHVTAALSHLQVALGMADTD